MGKYFVIIWKRLFRVLPVLLILCLLAGVVGYGVVRSSEQKLAQNNTKGIIALVGTETDPVLQMSLELVGQMDSSQDAVTLVPMTLSEATKALEQGEIMAYGRFPPKFMEKALQGRLEPVEYVSNVGNEGVAALLREELTSALSHMILSAEYGSFAIGEALAAHGYSDSVNDRINEIAFSYAALILHRDHVDKLQLSDDSDGMDAVISEIIIAGLCLVYMTFAPYLIWDDKGLLLMLSRSGCGCGKQVVAEWLALCGMVSILALLPVGFIVGFVDAIKSIPVVLALSSVAVFWFTLSRDALFGTTAFIFLCIVQCVVSGVIYPAYFLPVSVQKVGSVLPVGICKAYLNGMLEAELDGKTFILVLASIFVFLLGSVLVRGIGLQNGRRGKV